MPRYRLTLEYDGTDFVGWQRQATGRSIQQQLEEAIARFAGGPVSVIAAGRTDAGVHATGQVVHVDLQKPLPPFRVMEATNFHLKPEPIAVLAAVEVPDSFHARFDAVERRYRYRILNRRPPPVLARNRVWHVQHALAVPAMQEAASLLEGRHDFTSFRAALCQAKSPVKTLTRLTVREAADGPEGEEVWVEATAPSFLHHQVRNLVGTLVEVGLGRWQPTRMTSILAARNRSAAGQTAPAAGLTFLAVRYPGEEG
ncbi:MAG: tRNA pseudouridine(38-40) synthase TruA [Alphaproteobacteria bacterium]|nr:tRNA pseudouridine(38-40) synthase TruA [Alphaproteobacteria bacterium]TAD87531.1 MAG: tRNA pseudouridine(38-40) synthase TruA [Alphaproteobacteria bacterium]